MAEGSMKGSKAVPSPSRDAWRTDGGAAPRREHGRKFAACSVVLLATCLSGSADGSAWAQASDTSAPGKVGATADAAPDAPELDGAKGWLNTEKPLTLKELRGQVVLIDFWTYCCVNCMHVLPDLKYLEEKYREKPFVVVGVHSGKFDEEHDAANIRMAILRHNVEHPVVIDSGKRIWKAYGVRAWPTMVVIDPVGKIAGAVAGEGNRQILDDLIAALLEEHAGEGTIGAVLRHRRERESFSSGVLEFPGKVLADGKGKRLFISDTNHHRILVTDLDGAIQATIGDGRIGLLDGEFAAARFHQPRGLALSEDGGTLYVADTENHAIRAVDVSAGTVKTIAGTGQQGFDHQPAGPANAARLSSPWDLALVGDRLYVAMAGAHQIWFVDLALRQIGLLAGTGREARFDGPNKRATFAQPSGLATDGQRLYVADAEISTIRSVELGDDGRTATVAGGGELFEFGRRDGAAATATFQHPLGVALDGSTLYVADTFNHLIRRIDLTTGTVSTCSGTGRPELGDKGEIGFYEPGGISIADGVVYVADTNNHRIVAIDVLSRRTRVLQIGSAPRRPTVETPDERGTPQP